MINGSGSIEVICGPMFSGKTEELIRRVARADRARQKIACFKHSSDARYSTAEYASHGGLRYPCRLVISPLEIDPPIDAEVVAIDEAQFFGADLKTKVDLLAYRGVRVILAGLDQDYRGEPFGCMPALLAIADQITKQKAVCTTCGQDAQKSYRTTRAEEIVIVGATEAYEARCRRCHEIEPTETQTVDYF